MTVAKSRADLESRIGRFIDFDTAASAAALRAFIAGPLSAFGRFAIVGGMVRDFARKGSEGFSSDIDIVIAADPAAVASLAASLDARANAFGGWTALFRGAEIDFWSLETTWAVRAGHVSVSGIEDFTRTTFFDHDAALFDPVSRRVHCDDRYLDRLRLRTVDINLLPTASISGNLHRAARRILQWGLSPGPRLRSFIADNLDERMFRSLVETDLRKGHSPLIAEHRNCEGLHRAISGDIR